MAEIRDHVNTVEEFDKLVAQTCEQLNEKYTLYTFGCYTPVNMSLSRCIEAQFHTEFGRKRVFFRIVIHLSDELDDLDDFENLVNMKFMHAVFDA